MMMHLGTEEPDHEALIVTLRAMGASPGDFNLGAISIAVTMAADALDGRMVRVEPLAVCKDQMALFGGDES